MIDICLICARKGSKGLKNKNLKKILKKPLIAWTISQAVNSKLFDGVYVSTDCKKIAKISKKYGAVVPFLRSKKLSNDNVSKFSVWRDFLKRIEKFKKKKVRYFTDLDCTSPIRHKTDISKMLKQLKKNKNVDGIISICKSKKNPYFNMVEKNENKFLKISKKVSKNINARQLAPKVFDIIANTYCFRAEYIKRSKNLLGGKIIGYEFDQIKSFDIDNKYDFDIVELFLKKFKKNE